MPSQHSERAHFLGADKRNCTFGGGMSLFKKGGSPWCTGKAKREEGWDGQVPTAVSLVQAVGAVLDPVAGRHT